MFLYDKEIMYWVGFCSSTRFHCLYILIVKLGSFVEKIYSSIEFEIFVGKNIFARIRFFLNRFDSKRSSRVQEPNPVHIHTPPHGNAKILCSGRNSIISFFFCILLSSILYDSMFSFCIPVYRNSYDRTDIRITALTFIFRHARLI